MLAVEHAGERADGVVPLVGAADELLVLGVPGGEFDDEFFESEGFEHGLGEVDAGFYFALDLFGGAEDVSVVLREAAHAEQAVHGAGALVAVDVA